MTIAIIAICLFTPLLILWLTYRFPFLNKVGSIIIAYVIGCVLGNYVSLIFPVLCKFRKECISLFVKVQDVCKDTRLRDSFAKRFKVIGHLT